jgi:hypothetical protein
VGEVIGDMVGLPDNRSETCERRSAGCLGINPAKPKLAQIEFVDKDVNHPNGIVLANPVFQAFWKQRALPAIRPLNKSLHPIPLVVVSICRKPAALLAPGCYLCDSAKRPGGLTARLARHTRHGKRSGGTSTA